MKFKSSQEREKFILDNINLCWFVIYKNMFDKLYPMNIDDIYQESVYALISAVNNFDESKGFTFSTYAVSCIRLFLLRYIRLNAIIKPLRSGKNQKYGETPCVLSLNQIMDTKENKQDNSNEFIDNILDEKATAEFDLIDSELAFKQFLTRLSKKEIDVLKLKSKFFTQQDIAKELNMTQSCVSRILSKTRNKYYKFIQREE
nr:RNA polymerase sigma factor [Caudoviricetes sp.]